MTHASNQTSDSYGSRGTLPERGYDIHCPLFGGESERANYYRQSCIGRQQAKQCSQKGCRHRQARFEAPDRRRRRSHPPKPAQADTPVPPVRPDPQSRGEKTSQAQPRVPAAAKPAMTKVKRTNRKANPCPFDPADAVDWGGVVVTLVFDNADLYARLAAAARSNRRAVDMEILARLTAVELEQSS